MKKIPSPIARQVSREMLHWMQTTANVSITDYSAQSTITGWASFTTKRLDYKVDQDNTLTTYFEINGESNAATISFVLPYAAAFNTYAVLWSKDANQWPQWAWAEIAAGSHTVNIYKNTVNGAWDTSGTKWIKGQLSYEIIA